ncbi:ABC transporter substrate-binding protein [Paenibacillus naphthalenovorans]|uniref:ABC transporter substrate-binding protein n=1 Tax=Paenibacillus naphthalenovorans TaxID=162209 RepID=UPI003D2A5DFF
MKKVSVSLLFVVVLLSTVLLGCAKNGAVKGNASESGTDKSQTGKAESANTAPPKSETLSLSVGMLKYTTNAPLYIAMEKGFFKDENINAEFKFFDASKDVNVGVASGSVDVGASGLSADLYNMIASGQRIVIVANKGSEQKGYSYGGVVVHKDSPIRTVEDLKGKKIGVTSIGSTNHYNMGRILEKHGLNTKDVQWVSMNSVSSLMETLRSKNMDVVVLSEPTASITVNEGFGKVLTWVSDEINPESAAIFYSPKFAVNKEAGVRFLKAYIKGARYYYDAVLTQKDGKLVKGENFDEVTKIVAKYTDQQEDVIKGTFSFIAPDGKLNVDDIKAQIDWYVKEKFVTKVIDVNDFVNTGMLDEALKLVVE